MNMLFEEKNTDIVWVDIESTGLLEHPQEQIFELAAIITDKNLEVISTFPNMVVRARDGVVINEWSQEQHAQSGLLAEVSESTQTLEDLDTEFSLFLQEHGLYENIVIAGNGVSLDMKFIRHDLPKIASMFSHRIIDVSSFAEIVKRWSPELYKHRPKRQSRHRAASDIQDSLDEMTYYKEILPMLG